MTEDPSTTPDDTSSTDADANDAGKPRKERVLHTRVPAVLEQELKRLADSLRIPVSNVVRTILEDALDAVDVAGKRAEGEIRGAVTGARLAAGSQAFFVLFAEPGRHAIVGPDVPKHRT